MLSLFDFVLQIGLPEVVLYFCGFEWRFVFIDFVIFDWDYQLSLIDVHWVSTRLLHFSLFLLLTKLIRSDSNPASKWDLILFIFRWTFGLRLPEPILATVPTTLLSPPSPSIATSMASRMTMKVRANRRTLQRVINTFRLGDRVGTRTGSIGFHLQRLRTP